MKFAPTKLYLSGVGAQPRVRPFSYQINYYFVITPINPAGFLSSHQLKKSTFSSCFKIHRCKKVDKSYLVMMTRRDTSAIQE